MANGAWGLTGNGGTNPATSFLGTTDAEPLVIKTGGAERLRVDASGNVGIGTTAPNYSLHLTGGKALRIEGATAAADSANYFSFGSNGTFGIDAPGVPNGRFVVNNNGNVGIGTTSPGASLHVKNAGNTTGAFFETLRLESSNVGPGGGPYVQFRNAASVDTARLAANDIANFGGSLLFFTKPADGNSSSSSIERMRIDAAGNVGIGTSAPSSQLHVAGDVTVTGDVLLTGADCAEHFDVAGEEAPEPGTVVVIDAEGCLRESREPYDKKVAGVVSGAGGYRPGLLLDKRASEEGRIPVALVGKVYCKVDGQYSPIEVGDLLTTSPTPGHAMKAAEAGKAFGAIIGKALKPFESGQGMIPILIALQ